MYYKEFQHKVYTETQFFNNKFKIISTQLIQKDFASYEIILIFETHVLMGFSEKEKFEVMCFYENSLCWAECLFPTYENLTVKGDTIIHFHCNIRNKDCCAHSGFWEFFLPYAFFGQGDALDSYKKGMKQYFSRGRITFTLEDTEWELRQLYELGDGFTTFKEAVERGISENGPKISQHTVLRVSSQYKNREDAEKTATDICRLLQLALNNEIGWSVMHFVDEGGKYLVKSSSGHIVPKVGSLMAPLHQNPHENKIKEFLEKGYPIYRKNREWWNYTLSWFSQHSLRGSSIETQMMIVSMLLDRVSDYILKEEKFPCQISEELKEKEIQKRLKNILHRDIVAECPKWTEERTNMLMETIRNWNDRPPYQAKIKKAYEKVKVIPPSKELLKKRNKLLHNGELGFTGIDDKDEVILYWQEMSDSITELLLKMLGYERDFKHMQCQKTKKV